MEYLKIKNWDRWQSYRSDRGQPPWIKIHRCVMRNPEWVLLSDAEKGQLVSLWLLAADRDGLIPADEKLIQKLCFLSSPLKLNKFIELDFVCQDDAKTTPEGRQDDQPDKIREEKNRIEKRRTEKMVFNQKEFDIFYLAYPNPKAKKATLEKWKKLIKSNELPELKILLLAIEKQELWRKNSNGEFRPDWKHPSTWLHQGCWDDGVESKEPKRQYMSEDF